VSCAQFAEFAQDAKFKTDSETYAWSFVLKPHATPAALEAAEQAVKGADHWLAVPGASWMHPQGPGSDWCAYSPRPPRSAFAPLSPPPRGLTRAWRRSANPEHAVGHVSYKDAVAYCAWAGKRRGKGPGRLPSESEWEYAARGGLREKAYPWGDAAMSFPGDGRLRRWRANIWQGKFPKEDAKADGFSGPCPARQFEPNGFGLYNVVGNVWEWTLTPGEPDKSGAATRVLRGASFVDSEDGAFNHKATVNARMVNTEDSASSNTGVRCVYEDEPVAKRSPGYRYPKPKPRMDQETLSKIAEEGGIEALQKYLGDSAQVTTAKDLRERKEVLERQRREAEQRGEL
jgi:sulfatase modifying factor 1